MALAGIIAGNPSAGAGNGSARRLSCGVLVFNAQRELLLCHVTGQSHWDLPKGGLEAGESPMQAALRETFEETGLRLDGAALLDLGRFAYRAKKDLHLFATLLPRIEPSALRCESLFSERGSGTRLPEMDGYAWVGFGELSTHCTARMSSVLLERIQLGTLVDRLLAD